MYKKIIILIISVIILVAVTGCDSPVTGPSATKSPDQTQSPSQKENLQMNYTQQEIDLLNAYQEKQAGLVLSAYMANSSTATLTQTSDKIGDLSIIPDNLFGSGTVKYEGFISFAESGRQDIRVNGVDAVITIAYGELRHQTYDDSIEFLAGTYYGIIIEFSLKNVTKDTAITFSSKSAYRLSQTRPTFTGVVNPSDVTPLIDEHLRDAFILNGPDEYYYLIGTYLVKSDDWNHTNEIHIYRSPDLKDWTDLGCVWSMEKDGTWQNELVGNGNHPVWAPELIYVNDTYYIIYSIGWGAMSSQMLRSTTGKVEGPYEDISGKPMLDYIDGSIFCDNDGKVYAVYSDGRIALLDKDMKLTEEPKKLSCLSGMSVGFEGCSILNYNGKYILTSATYNTHLNEDGTTYTTYDCMYAVSDNLYGPYSERRLMLQYGGHNNLFVAKDGKIYSTSFYGRTFSERPAIVEIKIHDNGIITSPYELKNSSHIEEDKKFTLSGSVDSNSKYIIKIKNKAAITVYINGQIAFEARSSANKYYSYEIDPSLLKTDGSANEISYSKERRMEIDAFFEVWS